MIVSLILFILAQCESCLDAHKADILGGIEGGRYAHVTVKAVTQQRKVVIIFF